MALGFGPKPDIKLMRAAMLATMIPIMMGVAPLAGWLIGSWLGRLVSYPKTGALVGLFLGVGTAAREVYEIVRRLQKDLEEDTRQ